MKNETTPRYYEFDDFRLDLHKRLLLREGQPLRLKAKAFALLLVLLERRERVLDKDELMQAVWPDTVVEENNLTVHMSALRKALGEASAAPHYIVTIPGQGYRFIGRVKQVWDEEVELVVGKHSCLSLIIEEEESPEDKESLRTAEQKLPSPIPVISNVRAWRAHFFVPALALLLVLITSALYFWLSSKSQPADGQPVKSIAVLPFKPLRSDGNDEYLGLGLADNLITKLGSLRWLIVRPTSAVRKYTAFDQDPLTAGREQKVEAVLDGNLQRVGERLRVTVRLLRVAEGATLWSEQYDETYDADLFTLQDVLSERVAASLVAQLGSVERLRLRKRYTENYEAWQLYLQGRYFWNKRTAEGLQKSLSYFQQAVEKDPRYALAHAGQADCYLVLSDYGVLRPDEALLQAKFAAQQALTLDETLAEAHASMGFIARNYDYDWPSAEREFKRALELNPNYATAYHWYALYLAALTRFDEAFTAGQRAQELDPLSFAISAAVGVIHVYARQYEQASEVYRKMLELDPRFHRARQLLGAVYQKQGQHRAAIAELEHARRSDDRLEILAWLGAAYAAAGQRDKARQIVAQLQNLSTQRYVVPYDVALTFINLGEKDAAFAWLERAYAERSGAITSLKVDPRVDSLRADPRFADLLRRMGLAQ
jgi:DNA-binding winged helix-turn-helix (wHTH) protein/TolB-like protein/Tfp pilus assembly protein PilF